MELTHRKERVVLLDIRKTKSHRAKHFALSQAGHQAPKPLNGGRIEPQTGNGAIKPQLIYLKPLFSSLLFPHDILGTLYDDGGWSVAEQYSQ